MSEPDPVIIKGDRGITGERGEHGDHGQDGRQGERGATGATGPAGTTGRRGPNLKGTDLRLLIIFVYVTVAMALMFTVLHHQQGHESDRNAKFERQIATNCLKTNESNEAINAVLVQQAKNVQRSTALTAAQKEQALEQYSRLHLPISDCPPVD